MKIFCIPTAEPVGLGGVYKRTVHDPMYDNNTEFVGQLVVNVNPTVNGTNNKFSANFVYALSDAAPEEPLVSKWYMMVDDGLGVSGSLPFRIKNGSPAGELYIVSANSDSPVVMNKTHTVPMMREVIATTDHRLKGVPLMSERSVKQYVKWQNSRVEGEKAVHKLINEDIAKYPKSNTYEELLKQGVSEQDALLFSSRVFIETTTYERLSLYRQFSGKHDWKGVSAGCIRHIKTMNIDGKDVPLTVSFAFAYIDSVLVCMYEPTSQVVDYEAVKAYIRDNLFHDEEKTICYAENFGTHLLKPNNKS